jgi:predicted metalloprotease with PDZ domain
VNVPWAEEGLATYLEPIIRARAGLYTQDALWRSFIEGMPQGQPEGGDGGLDVTDSWGRRYWGGSIFWLLGDLEIRKRTGNQRSLDDALRAVNRAGGDVSVRWDLDRVLALADQAVGLDVLRPLRKQLGSAPVRVDLDAVWKSLGVSLSGRRVVYDDTAKLAAIRRSLIHPTPR